MDGRNELDKNLVRSYRVLIVIEIGLLCFTVCVCMCVCVFFLHHLIKLVNTSQRIQQRRFTIDSACKRKIARFVPRYSVVVAVVVVVIVITVVVDVCSQLAVRFRPSTADKRGVAFERNCESCIASRNRKRKGKFSRKGHIHRMYEQIQRGGVPSESYRPHAQWSVKKSLTRISPSSLSLSLSNRISFLFAYSPSRYVNNIT